MAWWSQCLSSLVIPALASTGDSCAKAESVVGPPCIPRCVGSPRTRPARGCPGREYHRGGGVCSEQCAVGLPRANLETCTCQGTQPLPLLPYSFILRRRLLLFLLGAGVGLSACSPPSFSVSHLKQSTQAKMDSPPVLWGSQAVKRPKSQGRRQHCKWIKGKEMKMCF